ncbi:uncharacterized protein [Lepeophtheirus salmonis]|uniref:uncharacterized protein isoform X1 n=2 Tax=Lepeophtheirus salmonis TaxID=72036 RepID=UPI001AE5F86D|nr:uncharacterized protein LOC121121932 [Lepeophtheirus salmonis]
MKRKGLINNESMDSQESIEMEDYSDEDDEVFLRNPRNGDSAVKRPLMKKSKKSQNGDFHSASIRSSKPKCRRCCGPLCIMFLGFKTIIGILIITIVLVNYFTNAGWFLFNWNGNKISHYAPCHEFKVFSVWQKNFPKFISEGNIRLVNITGDEFYDIVVPFGTGSDGYDVPDVVCDIYFDGQRPCLGGIMALDGKTGDTLWVTYTEHEVFALMCQGDLNSDTIVDCLAGGRAGLFVAISGKNGKVLWKFDNDLIQSDLMSVYVSQFIHDINGDHIPEILAVHGGDELSDPALEKKMFGRLIIFDGKSGAILKWMQTPDRKESYYHPQILTRMDGETLILFGTGGNSRPGSLYIISLQDLYKRNIDEAYPIYHDEEKGMLTPATLVDINRDGVEDIIIGTFNSRVIAFDGMTYRQIWNTTFSKSESYGSIAVGYYDEDDIPDFFVKYQMGKGYPVYEFEKSVVLSGLNGSKISKEWIDSIGSQSSPLTISVAGKGNDIFLHWTSNCKGHERERLKFSFPPGTSMHQQSRTDICNALFDAIQISQFSAFSRYSGSNQTVIYDSQTWASFEHSGTINTSALATKYLRKTPALKDYSLNYGDDQQQYSIFPYVKNDFEDKLALLEKELAESRVPNDEDEGIAYLEGESSPILLPSSSRKSSVKKIHSEVLPDIHYPLNQPHNIRKLPNELNLDLDDTFSRTKRTASHEFWGIHRLMSTGTLAPPIIHSNDSIDIVIASHWIYPSKTPVLQPEDEECIIQSNKEIDIKKSNLNEDELEELQKEIVSKCLKKSGNEPKKDRIYETGSEYDPYNVNMGQLSIYRFTLRCVCNVNMLKSGQECGRVLPFSQQGWPSFMGSRGDSRFIKRKEEWF